MKTLSINQMTVIEGGSLWNLVDGVCAGFVLGVAVTGGSAALNPIGAAVGTGCAVRGTYLFFSSL